MAFAAFATMMGPPVNEYKDEYEWKTTGCCPTSGGGTFSVIDQDTFEWTDAKGCPRGPFERDPQNPEHFVGKSSVWVLRQPRQPLKQYPSQNAALKGGAPTLQAIRRGDPDDVGFSSAAKALAAEQSGFASVKAIKTKENRDQRTRHAEEADWMLQQAEEKKRAQHLEIQEAIVNDKRKGAGKGKAPVEKEAKATKAEQAAFEMDEVKKALSADKRHQANKKHLEEKLQKV